VPSLLAQAPSQSGAPAAAALTKQYCVGCHSVKAKTAGIVLEGIDWNNVGSNAGPLEKALRKVRTGEMPPAGLPHPTAAAAAGFSTWLEGELDHAAAASPNPGRPAVHRLNRAEYGNAIRDLLALISTRPRCFRSTIPATASITSPMSSRSLPHCSSATCRWPGWSAAALWATSP